MLCAFKEKYCGNNFVVVRDVSERSFRGVDDLRDGIKCSSMTKSAEFKSWSGKLKTICTVTNINTVATIFEEDYHKSVRALAIELKISRNSFVIGNEASMGGMGTTRPTKQWNHSSFPRLHWKPRDDHWKSGISDTSHYHSLVFAEKGCPEWASFFSHFKIF